MIALVRLCGRLPLALRIVAETARFRPALTLESLAAELSDEQAGAAQATVAATQTSTPRRSLPVPRHAGPPADRCGLCQIRLMRER